jgi:uncharacterized protein (DUF1501 family)
MTDATRFVPTRRALLAAGGAFALTQSSLAFASTPGERKLVLVILRGALDGLAAVAPVADPAYARLRGRLALPPEAVLPLTDGFGLHPALTFLKQSWDQRELALLHAAASPYRDRSHFDAQDVLESGGQAVYAVNDGWLNRALGPSRQGVAIAQTVPLVLRGPNTASSWAPSEAPDAAADTIQRLMDLYAGDPLLAPALAQAVATQAVAEGAAMAGMEARLGRRNGPGAYRAVADVAARLLMAPGGPAAAVLSFDGWDTHANQGSTQGALAFRLAGLDAALGALKTALGPRWRQTVVVVASEFGRTVAENGTGGTDHGTGGVALVLGGGVRGGRFLGDWPGLAPAALYQNRDLAPANDLRALFAGVLAGHWGLDQQTLTSQVFPGASSLRPIGGLLA